MAPGHTDVTQQVGAGCPIQDVIERIGDKWSVLVVVTLQGGPVRFGGLLRRVEGISRRMLTRTLRLLERDGLVAREVFPTTPPAVEYSLTPLGHGLARTLGPVSDWALAHRAEVEAARRRYDEAAPGGVDGRTVMGVPARGAV